MTNDPSILCDDCFEHIAKTNMRAAKLWLDMCHLTIHQEKPLILLHDMDDRIILLESSGYIVTSEVNQTLLVRCLGRILDHDGDYFCPKGHS